MQSEVNDISERSLEKAREHDRIGNIGKAYAYYTIVAELCPTRRSEIEEAFTDVLCKLRRTNIFLSLFFFIVLYIQLVQTNATFRRMGDTTRRE